MIGRKGPVSAKIWCNVNPLESTLAKVYQNKELKLSLE
jgi:hypothetical protein